MPVCGDEGLRHTTPKGIVLCDGIEIDLIETNLTLGTLAHLPAQGRRHQLRAQAKAQNRTVCRSGHAHQGTLRSQVRIFFLFIGTLRAPADAKP